MILSDTNGGPWEYPTQSAPVAGAELVLATLRILGPATLPDIADRAGLSEERARGHLCLLRDLGRVRSTRTDRGCTLTWEAL